MCSFSGFFNLSVHESEQLPQQDGVPHVLDSDSHVPLGGWVGDNVSVCVKFSRVPGCLSVLREV